MSEFTPKLINEFSIERVLHTAPVRPINARICYDYAYNREILFLNFKNCSDQPIRSVYFHLICLDDAGDEVSRMESASLRSVDAAPSAFFGSDQPIVLENSNTYTVIPLLQKIVFIDGSVWRRPISATEEISPISECSKANGQPVQAVEPQPPLKKAEQQRPNHLNNEPVYKKQSASESMIKQLRTEPSDAVRPPILGASSATAPTTADQSDSRAKPPADAPADIQTDAQKEALYQQLIAQKPTDSAGWRLLADSLRQLGNYRDAAPLALNASQKAKRMKASEKRTAQKAAREAEALAIQQAKHRKNILRITGICIGTVLVITALILLFVFVLIPADRQSDYNDAKALYESGRYTDAITAFENLKGYADSEKIIRAIKLEIGGKEDAIFETTIQCPYYQIENGALSFNTRYTLTDGVLVLPDVLDDQPVTSLANNAFAKVTTLVQITLPDRVTSIGSSAFSGCTSLKSIVFSQNLKSIGANAFENCASLTALELPDSLTSIGSYAFGYCAALTEVTLPQAVTQLPDALFISCTSLKNVTLGNQITTIGASAFAYCSALSAIDLPQTVREAGNNAFAFCTSLTEIVLPDRMTELSGRLFVNCTGLKTVQLSSALTKIGSYTFQGCSGLETLSLPASVGQIGYSAFAGCTALREVIYQSTAENWEKITVQTENTPLLNAQIIYSE